MPLVPDYYTPFSISSYLLQPITPLLICGVLLCNSGPYSSSLFTSLLTTMLYIPIRPAFFLYLGGLVCYEYYEFSFLFSLLTFLLSIHYPLGFGASFGMSYFCVWKCLDRMCYGEDGYHWLLEMRGFCAWFSIYVCMCVCVCERMSERLHGDGAFLFAWRGTAWVAMAVAMAVRFC